jgi:hypothetical protein
MKKWPHTLLCSAEGREKGGGVIYFLLQQIPVGWHSVEFFILIRLYLIIHQQQKQKSRYATDWKPHLIAVILLSVSQCNVNLLLMTKKKTKERTPRHHFISPLKKKDRLMENRMNLFVRATKCMYKESTTFILNIDVNL